MKKGIVVDENNDLQVQVKRNAAGKIISGLMVGDTTYQDARFIIEAHKGEFKEYPTLGFGISRFLRKTTIASRQFVRELTVELESDNIKPRKINVSDDLQTFNIEL